MEKTKFKKGDLAQYNCRLVIPDGVKNKNVILSSILSHNKRAELKHTDQIGIIMETLKAGIYIGYIWYCQTTMDYSLVFEEELSSQGLMND